MNKTKFGALLGAFTLVLALSGCVADGTYYGGGPGYYGGGGGYYGGGGGGYGPGYYGAPAPVVVEGGPVYRETVVVDNTRYRGRDGYYYNGHRSDRPYYNGYRRGSSGYSRRGAPAVVERRGTNRRTPAPVYHRSDKKRHDQH